MISPATWLGHQASPFRHRAERRPVSELVAYRAAEQTPTHIRNISSSGIYLLTSERWPTGEAIPITLQREGPLEAKPERRISLNAVVVRWGDDGVALSFLLPAKATIPLWDKPANGGDPTELDEILSTFRVSRALAFVHRICPSAMEEVGKLLRGELSSYRAQRAVQIALEAEEILESASDVKTIESSIRMVERILLGGSWAEDQAARHWWAGFLASTCMAGDTDEMNVLYLDLLNMLADVHVHILNCACRSAAQMTRAEADTDFAQPSPCTIEAIQKATGLHDLLRVGRDIQYLIDLELVENKFRSSLFVPLEDIRVAPAQLGLQLYARCNWRPGS